VSLWDERAARNEALFREVNESIVELAERHGGSQTGEFVCECSRPSCATRIHVPLDVYEQVRAHPRRFVLASDHVDGTVERIVDRRDGYVIVEKEGAAGRVAERTNPRS
jgi:hypothetical protein